MTPLNEWVFNEADGTWTYDTHSITATVLVLKVAGPNYPDVVAFQALNDDGFRISATIHKNLLDAQTEALAWLEDQQ